MVSTTGNIFIALTVLAWGVGSFLGKIALKDVSGIQGYMLEALGTLTVFVAVAVLWRRDIVGALGGITPAGYLFGILWGVGTVTFVMALKYRPASIAVPLTGLYPFVTVLLAALFLKEVVTVKSALGIAFALAAGVLLL